ncbi:MAG TPA: VCBS repeat-containing protein, partial [Opitutus sp.]|nr:VCBS repeat-containing protein [Opitutus sp.]
AQFGYYEGQVQWLENLGEWKFAERPLLDLPGAIHAPIVDYNRDGKPDIVALVSQDWEEVWGFQNRGGGDFERRVLQGSTNRDYGSSGLCIADVDRDGHSDIVYTNGDGFDYATPGSRPWHGVQWLRNDGQGNFRFRRIGDFAGAYSPVVVDLDDDGDRDVVAVSAFNDWAKPEVVSLMCFENDGRETFTPRVLAHAPTHLVVAKAADMDGDGRVELITGSFAFYPPLDRAGRVTLWEGARTR